MTPAQIRNLLIHTGLALASMLAIAVGAALAGGTMPGFREGEFFAPAAPTFVALIALLTPILTSAVAATRPKLGQEETSALVKEVGPEAAKAALEVEAIAQQTGASIDDRLFTPAQVDQIAGRLLELRAEHERVSVDEPAPAWLPERGH